MSPLCLRAALIGLLYPFIDRRLGEPHRLKREWSSVMRCVAVFVGINHASAVSFRPPSFCRAVIGCNISAFDLIG